MAWMVLILAVGCLWVAARPVISVLGANPVMVDVNADGASYEDQGALCQQGTHELTNRIVMSGDTVQLSRPDVYHVKYDCMDAHGVSAIHAC